MRYFVDSEFVDDGSTIDLISIGIVAEDGRELYLQSCEFDASKASPWVKENVLAHLEICPWANATLDSRQPYVNDLHYHKKHGQCVDQNRGWIHNCPWRTREQMQREIFSFMDPLLYGKPKLHGWCSGYDFVAFCQIFGTMMDLPPAYPHYIKDLQYVLDERGISDEELPEQEEGTHNALSDARHIKRLYEFLQQGRS